MKTLPVRPRRLCGLCLLLGFFPTLLWADAPRPHAISSVEQLKCLSVCELEQLFGAADPGPLPCGYARGRILILTEGRLPRLQACLAGAVWKGKHFEEDGQFVNQWLGFRAIRSHAEIGPSWYDGCPAIVMEYAPGTPVFANTRDELREIGPGLYLGRIYARCPCPKFRIWIALEMQPAKECH